MLSPECVANAVASSQEAACLRHSFLIPSGHRVFIIITLFNSCRLAFAQSPGNESVLNRSPAGGAGGVGAGLGRDGGGLGAGRGLGRGLGGGLRPGLGRGEGPGLGRDGGGGAGPGATIDDGLECK